MTKAHDNMQNRFSLSGAGKVSVAITLAFLLGEAVAAAGIVAAGPDGPSVRTMPNGAQVVNIVKPGAAGLSHNRFNDYNIDRFGAVLNNSTAAGRSQLAGQLEANGALGGQAARIILGEVVSRNPSLLLGQQEIFGSTAAFVLANPNGITCNGCGFINTSRASLVVGTPQVSDGQLLGVRTAADGSTLSIGQGGIGGADVLDLIAPRIEARGLLRAGSALSAITGGNTVGYADLKVTAGPAAGPLAFDSVFLGGMQAGRISVISTADGAGVNVAGKVQAAGAVDLRSAGRLDLAAVQLDAGGDALLAGRSVNVHGIVRHDASHQEDSKDSWFIWKTGETRNRTDRTSDTVEGSTLKADTITIRAEEAATLSASRLKARSADVSGATVTLAAERGQVSLDTQHDAWLNSWSHNERTQQRDETVAGVQVDVVQDLALTANGAMNLTAATLNAGGNVTLATRGDLQLDAAEEAHDKHVAGARKNEGAALATGSWSSDSVAPVLVATRIRAGGNLALGADGGMTLRGATLSAGGDAGLSALRGLSIGTQAVDARSASSDSKLWWGGIGGGARSAATDDHQQVQGSLIEAGGRLDLQAGDALQVTASQLHGKGGAHAVSLRGAVQVDAAIAVSRASSDTRKGGAFNITTASSQSSDQQGRVVAASLRSDADLVIDAADSVRIAGSGLDAKGGVTVAAGGAIGFGTVQETGSSTHRETALGWTTSARATGDKQYEAGLGLAKTTVTQAVGKRKDVGSTVSGDSVTVRAGSDLTLKGSVLSAGTGGMTLAGDAVTVLAGTQTRDVKEGRQVDGGGLYLTAGLDVLGGGVRAGGDHRQTDTATTTATGSTLQSGGDVHLAAGALVQEGSTVRATGDVQIVATTIDQHAAVSSVTTRDTHATWQGDLGAGLQTGAILRPVEAKLTGLLQGQPLGDDKTGQALAGAASHLKDGDLKGAVASLATLGKPGVAGQLAASGETVTTTAQATTAVVTSVTGAGIAVKADGAVQDAGTRLQATSGAVSIRAGSYAADAVQNHEDKTVAQGSGSATLSAGSMTGIDLTVGVKAAGETRQSSDVADRAQAGQLRGANGVRIVTDGDVRLVATGLDAGKGDAVLTAGGKVVLDAVSDRTQHMENHAGGSGGLELAMTTTGQVTGGGGNLSVSAGKAASGKTVAVVASVAGNGLNIAAGGDLVMNGSTVNVAGAASLAAAGKLALNDAASSSQSSAQGGQAGLGIHAGATKGDGTLSVSGSDSQDRASVQGGVSLKAGSVTATGSEIRLQDSHLAAGAVSLTATQGGIAMQSQADTAQHAGTAVDVALNAGGSQGVSGLGGASVKGQTGQSDAVTFAGGRIDAGTLSLTSKGDTVLAGAAIKADSLNGEIGGQLQLAGSLATRNATQTTFDAGVKGSYAVPAATTPVPATPAPSTWDKVVSTVKTLATDPANLVHADIASSTSQHAAVDVPAGLAATQSTLKADGGVTVRGATLALPAGSVPAGTVTQAVGGSEASQTTTVKLSSNPATLVQTAIGSALAGKVPFVTRSADQKDLTVPGTITH